MAALLGKEEHIIENSVNCTFNPLITPAFYFLIILTPIVSFEAVKLHCWFAFSGGFFLFVCLGFLVQLGLSLLLFSHANLIKF